METDRSTLETETFDTVFSEPIVCLGLDVVGQLSSLVKAHNLTAEDVRELEDLQKKVCSICLDDYRVDDVTRTLPACGHRFHERCIWGWMMENLSCPVCRAKIDGRLVRAFQISESVSDAPRNSKNGRRKRVVVKPAGLRKAAKSRRQPLPIVFQ